MEQTLITDNFTLVFMLLSLALLVAVVVFITFMSRHNEKPDSVKKIAENRIENDGK